MLEGHGLRCFVRVLGREEEQEARGGVGAGERGCSEAEVGKCGGVEGGVEDIEDLWRRRTRGGRDGAEDLKGRGKGCECLQRSAERGEESGVGGGGLKRYHLVDALSQGF